ncbi:MAG: AIR synthase-related protein [Candidatus Bathyarchaeota archaeon]|nr:AIR synthase-related protein [Candidatus Bathyarchaeota archaeon]
MGKLAAKDLQKMLNCIQCDQRVLVPPQIGYDSGIHRIGDLMVAVAADPCTGVPEEWFGWLLINYAASDVALSGAKPQFCTITLLGPRPTDPLRFQRVMEQTCRAADELGVAIVRGHTGMYDSLNDLLGVCTVYGEVDPKHLKTSGDAEAGDLILCTKPLGVETITNYALAHPEMAQKLFGAEKQKKYAQLIAMQSCVKEAQVLAKIEGVHALHDATEGGFVAALNELAAASKVGFEVHWNEIAVPSEALALQGHFGLSDAQVLAFSSTGTILGAIHPKAKQSVTKALQQLGLTAYFIGEFTNKKARVLHRDNLQGPFPAAADDPYTMMLAATS